MMFENINQLSEEISHLNYCNEGVLTSEELKLAEDVQNWGKRTLGKINFFDSSSGDPSQNNVISFGETSYLSSSSRNPPPLRLKNPKNLILHPSSQFSVFLYCKGLGSVKLRKTPALFDRVSARIKKAKEKKVRSQQQPPIVTISNKVVVIDTKKLKKTKNSNKIPSTPKSFPVGSAPSSTPSSALVQTSPASTSIPSPAASPTLKGSGITFVMGPNIIPYYDRGTQEAFTCTHNIPPLSSILCTPQALKEQEKTRLMGGIIPPLASVSHPLPHMINKPERKAHLLSSISQKPKPGNDIKQLLVDKDMNYEPFSQDDKSVSFPHLLFQKTLFAKLEAYGKNLTMYKNDIKKKH